MSDEAIRETFSGLGDVTIRKMFGGKGIYHDALIVGVELRGEILLKADAVSAPDFEAAGAKRWTDAGGRPVNMPYWTIPESAVDDPDELAVWTRKAYEAALRTRK
ncbi:DNA transformation protein [Aminobacter lissarensis]|uniref:DNA transformation protein n=1 Tax=Aminobacter carboxidus TaxID=376165 RepID=A0A8E1WFQ1_9HYPH|nr:TfoX/Sxy family protein [Aminobacter lissarensis]MBB6466512.1 DNA transformation protein [Aminobacter lissarensis]